jgi:hypothetical protein
MTEPPIMIPVACENYDKILDEVADLLYSFLCKYQGQWLDPIQQNSTVDGLTQTSPLSKKGRVLKPRRRTAS